MKSSESTIVVLFGAIVVLFFVTIFVSYELPSPIAQTIGVLGGSVNTKDSASSYLKIPEPPLLKNPDGRVTPNPKHPDGKICIEKNCLIRDGGKDYICLALNCRIIDPKDPPIRCMALHCEIGKDPVPIPCIGPACNRLPPGDGICLPYCLSKNSGSSDGCGGTCPGNPDSCNAPRPGPDRCIDNSRLYWRLASGCNWIQDVEQCPRGTFCQLMYGTTSYCAS
jgi:hypothetical protein